MDKKDFDAVVVGSGPNGLAAAILLRQQGLSVLLVEGKETIGGGLRTAELTLPGFLHDVCSAVHPLAAGSLFFKTLPLHEHGLEYIYPPLAAAHPFDGGGAAILSRSIEETAQSLGKDASVYSNLIEPIVKNWPLIASDVLGPLHFPEHPLALARFGLKAFTSVTALSKIFSTQEGKGLLAGMAAHSIQPLSNVATSAFALVLMTMGHLQSWPIPKGGSEKIAAALAGYFIAIGGKIETNFYVDTLGQLPSAHALILDITPRQLLHIAGHRFSPIYKWQLERYRYGMGVFKIDWALDKPIPFISDACLRAGTIHLGNTLGEITYSEQQTSEGKIAERPFVLLAQQSLFDDTRAPAGKHTAWAYCHVPNGSTVDMTSRIEEQVERFAPGFGKTILGRHMMNASDLETYNPNYIGGDINGGIMDIGQLFTRPALRFSPYRTSLKNMYICSSSTPPGGGVHGMCGYHAAKKALHDIFHIDLKKKRE
ncbi:MAG: NAD(P)/FAD-dependent oxidoreductase [Flavitalea sp.]